MSRIDITVDLNSADENGFLWTFLDEAEDPLGIRPGEAVVAGSPLTPTACEAIDLVCQAVGTVVLLRVLPGGTAP